MRTGILLIVAAGLAVGGCSNGQPRFKSVESYNNATSTNDYKPYRMDPGSFGGVAEASGGTKPGMSYGTGAQGPDQGDPGHYARMKAVSGDTEPDWGGGESDSLGIKVPPAAGAPEVASKGS